MISKTDREVILSGGAIWVCGCTNTEPELRNTSSADLACSACQNIAAGTMMCFTGVTGPLSRATTFSCASTFPERTRIRGQHFAEFPRDFKGMMFQSYVWKHAVRPPACIRAESTLEATPSAWMWSSPCIEFGWGWTPDKLLDRCIKQLTDTPYHSPLSKNPSPLLI